jgi:hypothetical protein
VRRAPWLLAALLITGCTERWTLWTTVGNDASKVEAGLDRQTCEMLRDRHERQARAQTALLYDLERQLVAAGGRSREPIPVEATYRCRREGE